MAGTSGIGFSASLVVGAVLATAVAVGAYFSYQTIMVPDDVPAPIPAPAAQSEPAASQTAALETSQSDTVPVAAPEATPVPDTVPDPANAPSFDVVRVEPDGSSVIAGNAASGAKVSILLDGTTIGQATADNQGNFVALLNVPSGTNAQVLSLSTQHSGGAVVVSNDSVILAPVVQPEPQTTEVAQVEPETNVTALVPATPTSTPTATPDETDVTAAVEAPVTEPTPTPAAPAVLLANEQGVQVIQPAERGPAVMGNVMIDAISYDALGEVQLSGRGADQGSETGFVRVYLNDAPIQTTQIGADGGWHTALPNVDTGIYVLRVDQVDSSGTVTSRTQTPFKRETAEVLANAQAEKPTQKVTAVTVQPGSTLWAIARDNYGDGMLYVRVFEANSDSIRNPDLIYPGQVFQVPE